MRCSAAAGAAAAAAAAVLAALVQLSCAGAVPLRCDAALGWRPLGSRQPESNVIGAVVTELLQAYNRTAASFCGASELEAAVVDGCWQVRA